MAQTECEVFACFRVDGPGKAGAPGIDHASHGGPAQAEPGPAVPSTYTHVVVAAGTKMVFIAGQEPAGARPGQVAKITIYVVHYAIAVTDR